MRGAASLGKKRQTLSLPPTCTQLVLCEKGKFSLDGSFSKNAPYKQKIIFHLTSIGKMSRKIFFLPWTVGRWYCIFLILRGNAQSRRRKYLKRKVGEESLSKKWILWKLKKCQTAFFDQERRIGKFLASGLLYWIMGMVFEMPKIQLQ